MLSQWSRTWFPRITSPFTRWLLRQGLTPNALTAAGLILAGLSGVCIAFDRLIAAAAFLALSGICDALDGELARQLPQSNRLGPFIDSVADHYGDFAIALGAAWRALAAGDKITVLLVMTALFGSLVGSHIRSRAGMAGIDLKNAGFFTRMERTLVLLVGLVSGRIMPAVAVLALANNLSALQRIFHTVSLKDR